MRVPREGSTWPFLQLINTDKPVAEQDIKRQVGELIRKARKAKGLTQQELAERLVLSQNTISDYESGKQNLTIETLQKVSDALDGAIFIGLKK